VDISYNLRKNNFDEYLSDKILDFSRTSFEIRIPENVGSLL